MFIHSSMDTVGDHPVTLSEHFAIMSNNSKQGAKSNEQGGLSDTIVVGIGMKVMVTSNVETDLDITNRARGEIIQIILDDKETSCSSSQSIVHLQYPPVYILIKMTSSKVARLKGLHDKVISLIPIERKFFIKTRNTTKSVTHRQIPLTAAYAFMDYRSQGQTIHHAIIDIVVTVFLSFLLPL